MTFGRNKKMLYEQSSKQVQEVEYVTYFCRRCRFYDKNRTVSCTKYNMVTKEDCTCKSWEKKNK